jgi:hypothetical protein
VHIVWNELGPDATRYTINNTQFTVNHWLLQVRLLLPAGKASVLVVRATQLAVACDKGIGTGHAVWQDSFVTPPGAAAML